MGGEKVLHIPTFVCQELFTLYCHGAGPGQIFLVVQGAKEVEAGSAAKAAYDEIARILQDHDLTMVHERLFGSLSVKPAILASRAKAFRASNLPTVGPFTFIQGQPFWGKGFAGVIIQAVFCRPPQDEVWTIMDQGMAVGRGWRQGGATFLLLQNLQGLVTNRHEPNDRPHQVRRVIQLAVRLLERQEASYRDVVRTWFYLADILAWYPQFNWTRNLLYQELGLMPIINDGSRRLPASTGIGGAVSLESACALDLLAVAGPSKSRPPVRYLLNPAQPEALTYGSAFSRGTLICHSDFNLIQVSGTAAIDDKGDSLYPGDVGGQIECTFDKIAALIRQEGGLWRTSWQPRSLLSTAKMP
jgi:enamine deaminase RidA (YjgF/YER057c/UK114 family)